MLEGQEIAHTLVASLTPVVDKVRNIATCLGARPYQVSLIWTQWSGETRGDGVEQLLLAEMILPTPKIADLTALTTNLQPIGSAEVGSLRISEISPRYTEDKLLGRNDRGAPIGENISFYWEIFFPRAGGPGVRRRFTPKSAPSYAATRAQWEITLLKASGPRSP